jgi:hypothetical protein
MAFGQMVCTVPGDRGNRCGFGFGDFLWILPSFYVFFRNIDIHSVPKKIPSNTK